MRYTILILMLLALGQVHATPFTYQGYLDDAGQPAVGSFDFEFSLLDSAGNSLGTPVVVEDLLLTNGVFSVSLDFGPGVFDGTPRWLQIGVRPGSSTAAYTYLTPHQAVTPTPYADWAEEVADASVTAVKLAAGAVDSLAVADGSLAAVDVNSTQVQLRVGGSCVPGEAIRSIAADGSVQCEVDDDTIYSAGNGLLLDTAGQVFSVDTGVVQVRLQNACAANQSIQAIDATGVVSCKNDETGADWSLNGNTLTGSEWLGSMGNNPVDIRVNSQSALRIEPHTVTGLGAIAFEAPSIVAGSNLNTAPFEGSVVAGGASNPNDQTCGLNKNQACHQQVLAAFGVVSGGLSNQVNASYSAIGGGLKNLVQSDWSSVYGGMENRIESGQFAFIGGGLSNRIQAVGGNGAVLVGGESNNVAGSHAVVVGGQNNLAAQQFDATLSGVNNITSGGNSVVAGGSSNQLYGSGSFIGSGQLNQIVQGAGVLPLFNVIGGGSQNTIRSSHYSVIGGGSQNNVLDNAEHASIGGGKLNYANSFASVAGGSDNGAWGLYSTIPGGNGNQVLADFAFAAGRNARVSATGTGSFVWADSTTTPFTVGQANLFAVRANGGVWLGTADTVNMQANSFLGTSTGAFLSTGGTWTNNSDRERKTDIQELDEQDILERLAQVPVKRWRYRSEAEDIQHIGPMAQDFYQAFALGGDEKHIPTVDADGVLMAAVQALYRRMQQQEQELNRLRRQLQAMQAEQAVSEPVSRMDRDGNGLPLSSF